jgi:adenosylcobinamide kinase/adenosylcobinamide-phosphate guanylyltransferase
MTALSPLPPVTFVLGGARSGKSSYGETLVELVPGPCIYLATAQAGDPEMIERIQRHRRRRGERWRTVEEPLELGRALQEADSAVLVDCLTLWLSNLMHAGRDTVTESDMLLMSLPVLTHPVVFVSNEVGQGIVPDNPLARRFRDEAGRLNQAMAAAADQVIYMVAGLPMTVKAR